MNVPVKKLAPHATIPNYAYEGDAGLDLHSSEQIILKPNEKKLVKTDISMAIPKGFVGLIWDRSGLAAKKNLHVLAGVIDSTYRGEIKIVLANLGNSDFQVNVGDKIAQMLIQPVHSVSLVETAELDETKRQKGGFGSTGI